jgi:damage-control phosphatase, subfamily I
MKTRTGCIPCIMKQAYNTAVRATSNDTLQHTILSHAADHVKTIDLEKTPADNSNYVYELTTRLTGRHDPYHEEKIRYNDLCMNMTRQMKKTIEYSIEPLHYAIKAAIFGNIIDLGIGMEFDLDRDAETIFSEPLAIDHYNEFRKNLESGRKKILYLGDNAGEIVFDMLLIDELRHDHDVTYTVKSGPIINDATMQDAKYVGMTDMVKVIETGTNGIGVKWGGVSEEFRTAFKEADIIISKGQGNFETINECKGDIFFLLRAKCEFVADELGVKLGDIVFKRNIHTQEQ